MNAAYIWHYIWFSVRSLCQIYIKNNYDTFKQVKIVLLSFFFTKITPFEYTISITVVKILEKLSGTKLKQETKQVHMIVHFFPAFRVGLYDSK
jgi:hypothetical protein